MMRIAELRKARGLSRIEVGNALGVTYDAVAAWELGRNMPTPDKLPALARLFHVTIEELYTEEVRS